MRTRWSSFWPTRSLKWVVPRLKPLDSRRDLGRAMPRSRNQDEVTNVVFTAAPEPDRHRDAGLLGFVSFRLGDLRIDCVTLRRTAKGELALSFAHGPRGRNGRRRTPVRPACTESLTRIEDSVFEALGLQREGDEA